MASESGATSPDSSVPLRPLGLGGGACAAYSATDLARAVFGEMVCIHRAPPHGHLARRGAPLPRADLRARPVYHASPPARRTPPAAHHLCRQHPRRGPSRARPRRPPAENEARAYAAGNLRIGPCTSTVAGPTHNRVLVINRRRCRSYPICKIWD